LGLVAAVHTPFTPQLELNLDAVEKQARHLVLSGIKTVFIGGSTGESHSLTLNERMALAKQWAEVVRHAPLKLVVHVGSNCMADARTLAAQAQQLGASAISALAPSYFKPSSVDALIACCASIAEAAPKLPFYFYDIPSLTGVHLSMPDFLAEAGKRVPNLAGIKFTNFDLVAYQRCLSASEGRFDIPWGIDECLLAATVLGASGAVGSSYNFAAPVYHRVLEAYAVGDIARARREQLNSVRLITVLGRRGYMPSAKAVMGFLGVNVGPARLPHGNLAPDDLQKLRAELEDLGFFDWVKAA
jgi:N-acetylneuraminate lyase